jgi:hypothetical protein
MTSISDKHSMTISPAARRGSLDARRGVSSSNAASPRS